MRETAEIKPRKPPRAVAYLRVSTDEQAEGGAGLDAQSHACRGYAERAGLELIGPFSDDEGISSTDPIERRPALVAALAELGPGDVLLVAKRDRIGRDPFLVAMVEGAAGKKGARVVSAAGEGTESDDPTSVLMRRIIDAFAEFERLCIRTRTKGAIDSLRRRGRVSGVIPYGFRAVDDGQGTKSSKGVNPAKLVADPAERIMIGTMAQLREAGHSLRAIARFLNEAGHATRRGGKWKHSTVGEILSRHPAGEIGGDDAQA